MEQTEEQKLQGFSINNGMNAWEYVNLFSEEKREWVTEAILSCIDKGLELRSETISIGAGSLKYEKKPFYPTKRQMELVASRDFWLNGENGRRFQEFLPPYSLEDVIREMKARGQYRTTGWLV